MGAIRCRQKVNNRCMASVLRGPAAPLLKSVEEQQGDRTICAHKSPACFFISFNMNLPACPVPVTYEASRTTVVQRLIASRDSARQRGQFEKSSPVNPFVRSFDRSASRGIPRRFSYITIFERLTSGISKTSIRFFSFCSPCIFRGGAGTDNLSRR